MGLAASRTNRAASRLATAAASTPGPWRVGEKRADTAHNWHPIVALHEGCSHSGKTIAWALAGTKPEETSEANAAFIVRAVNAYDDMLAALKLSLKRLTELNRDDEAGMRMVIANAILKVEAVGDRTAPAKTETGA